MSWSIILRTQLRDEGSRYLPNVALPRDVSVGRAPGALGLRGDFRGVSSHRGAGDPENEAAISETVKQVSRECAVLVIAHRVCTVREADEVPVVDKGELSREGSTRI